MHVRSAGSNPGDQIKRRHCYGGCRGRKPWRFSSGQVRWEDDGRKRELYAVSPVHVPRKSSLLPEFAGEQSGPCRNTSLTETQVFSSINTISASEPDQGRTGRAKSRSPYPTVPKACDLPRGLGRVCSVIEKAVAEDEAATAFQLTR